MSNYDFILPPNNPGDSPTPDADDTNIFPTFDKNLEFVKLKFNSLINSDIIIREFNISANGKKYRAVSIGIDGMINSDMVNNSLLRPLMLGHDTSNKTSKTKIHNIRVRPKRISKTPIKDNSFDLENYLYNMLIPQNSISKTNSLNELISSVNTGSLGLIVENVSNAFLLDVKGFEKRSISEPNNEAVIRGAGEAFVEHLRTNTSMLRRIINNENLIIENTHVGSVSNTQVAICYMKNIANDDLVAEVKYRINNIDVDYIISSRSIRTIYTRQFFYSSSSDASY